MYRARVRSSNLYSVGYDQLSQTLEIEFWNGAVYQYVPVPVSVYNGLMSATSKGRYFARAIRVRYSCALVA
jgi:hypothetical protein